MRLELTFPVPREDGGIQTPLRDGCGRWPDGALPGDVLELLGTRARVVGHSALAELKSSHRDDPADAEKDRADYGALERRIRS